MSLSIRMMRAPRLLLVWIALIASAACDASAPATREAQAEAPEVSVDRRTLNRINAELGPEATPDVPLRDGLAAAVLIDVSGSMERSAPGGRERKLDVAKRAAIDLVEQFARYADDHRDVPVLLAIYEFSSERRGGDVREVVAMGRPNREAAAAAIREMRADGGTPIGDAMIAGKRALDATGVTRRHLLLVTDGENTDGFEPGEVAVAINQRPFEERPSIYFVAFDIEARRFRDVQTAGGLVMEAASGKALGETIDSLLRGRILIEK